MMKRALSIFLALLLLFACAPTALAADASASMDAADAYLEQGGTLTLQNDLFCAAPWIESNTVLDLNGHTLSTNISNYSCPPYSKSVDGGEFTPYAHVGLDSGTTIIKNGIIDASIDALELEVGENATLILSNVWLRGENLSLNIFGNLKVENCYIDEIGQLVSGWYASEEEYCLGTVQEITGTVVHVNPDPTWNLYASEIAASFFSPDNEKLVGKCEAYVVTTTFTDVKPFAYYFVPAYWALSNGVTTGKSATSFAPLDSFTRGEVATFLWRAMGKPEPQSTANPFTDVKESDYYYKPILWAVEQGITNGTSATTFSPAQACTSAHILTFLWRAMGEPFQLGSGEHAWYEAAAQWAKLEHLLDSTSAESSLTGNCPRGDVVTFLYRALVD